jgi:hypothetical protein
VADDEANPLLARADAVIHEAQRLQAEMDETLATAELNAHRLEETFLKVRTIILLSSVVRGPDRRART